MAIRSMVMMIQVLSHICAIERDGHTIGVNMYTYRKKSLIMVGYLCDHIIAIF